MGRLRNILRQNWQNLEWLSGEKAKDEAQVSSRSRWWEWDITYWYRECTERTGMVEAGLSGFHLDLLISGCSEALRQLTN